MEPYEIAGAAFGTWPVAVAIFVIIGLALLRASRKDVNRSTRWGRYWLALTLAFLAYFSIWVVYVWLSVREL